MITFKKIMLYVMSVLYVAAGINHFYKPTVFVSIVPAFLPAKLLIVYISGVCEIMLGLLLLP
ncbi:MAG: DoxX family protein, partial [Parafilimonas sp.]